MNKKLAILFLILLVFISLTGCGERKEGPFPEDISKDPWGIEGKVAFGTSRGEHPYGVAIYEMGKIKRITNNGSGPRWSPEGKRILITNGESITIVSPDTGISEHTPTPVYETAHAWMPDGKKILIAGYDREKGSESAHNLFLYDSETKEWQQLTHFQNKEKFYFFDVFKDGKRILCSYMDDPSGRGMDGVYVYSLETKDFQLITKHGSQVKLMPDEKSFVMTSSIRRWGKLVSPSEIFLVDLTTGKEAQLTQNGTWKSRPTVSPDGKTVLYSAQLEDGERIFKLDIKTKREKEIFDRTPGYAGKIPHDRSPDWAP